MIPSSPIFHKPKSILAAKNILYTVIFLGIAIMVVIGMNIGFRNYTGTPEWFAGVASLVIVFLLVRFIELGKRWGRIVFLFFFFMETVLVPLKLIFLLRGDFLLDVLFLIEGILQLFALKFLFSEKSTRWFIDVKYAAQQS
jgi:hypothetical protein